MIVNTSLVCWISTETGHLEFQDAFLIKQKRSKGSISYLRVELDHAKAEVIRLLIRVEKTDDLIEI